MGLVSFEEIYAFKHTAVLSPVWTFMEQHHRAKVVFETIDSDGSGTLSIAEIGALLISWGVPPHDVRLVLETYDKDGSGELNFQEFFNNFRICYEFAFGCIKEAVQQNKAMNKWRKARTDINFEEIMM